MAATDPRRLSSTGPWIQMALPSNVEQPTEPHFQGSSLLGPLGSSSLESFAAFQSTARKWGVYHHYQQDLGSIPFPGPWLAAHCCFHTVPSKAPTSFSVLHSCPLAWLPEGIQASECKTQGKVGCFQTTSKTKVSSEASSTKSRAAFLEQGRRE